MTINLHDITGQESGIILVETDDGRHMNVVANWGASGRLVGAGRALGQSGWPV